jgi:hypothetical protein
LLNNYRLKRDNKKFSKGVVRTRILGSPEEMVDREDEIRLTQNKIRVLEEKASKLDASVYRLGTVLERETAVVESMKCTMELVELHEHLLSISKEHQ